MKKILITGSSGFIGYTLAKRLLDAGHSITGIDNHNSYYNPKLKDKRKALLESHSKFIHYNLNLSDPLALGSVFDANHFDQVINLAAEVGVRNSVLNPKDYINTNIKGFFNLIDCVKESGVKSFIYASSSSVYGGIRELPFKETAKVDNPLNLYAATKMSNELISSAYSQLFDIQMTGLRFFTVYGPWGRPDMAPFKFLRKILKNEPIDIYNNGEHSRDFTFVDDIVEGITLVSQSHFKDNVSYSHTVYNIGNGQPIKLMSFIEALEEVTEKKAIKNFMPKQPGDMDDTLADLSKISSDLGYLPRTSLHDGLQRLVMWYRDHEDFLNTI